MKMWRYAFWRSNFSARHNQIIRALTFCKYFVSGKWETEESNLLESGKMNKNIMSFMVLCCLRKQDGVTSRMINTCCSSWCASHWTAVRCLHHCHYQHVASFTGTLNYLRGKYHDAKASLASQSFPSTPHVLRICVSGYRSGPSGSCSSWFPLYCVPRWV